ncbi:HD domain-containing phosphohydrolase [Pseudalkalibacillus berkeleyi]|uniref:HD domain-containing protein n=1 Tax=Pseudalkalibacillus berkeleyi TaxID=1069813 RepID=A0ABS9H378_9BACL|nr:HD domain-containing phosphohydrolase [Pseudalkalibacillus berkeleyi]MCF6139407.1 HD domain-containing protein [Pseudalkalibacillus berkeleyi]
MATYDMFLKQLVKNYLIGSFVAVGGIGSMFIFRTLTLSVEESIYMLIIILISLLIMISCEFISLRKHLEPIKSILHNNIESTEQIKKSYLHTQRFPILAFKRTIGPHLLGLSIPATTLSYLFIQIGWLNIPIIYIGYAFIGAILVASVHGMIEYYLTSKSILPVLEKIRTLSLQHFHFDPSAQPVIQLTLRKKFLFATIFISVFPLLLFSLASQVRLGELESIQLFEYWSWAILIIGISIGFSLIGSYLFYKDVGNPIDQLTDSMKQIEHGTLQQTSNTYTDEFSSLVNGFNQMVEGLEKRDQMNMQLIESFYSVLSATLDARDPYTAGHSKRVSEYSVQIGKLAGLPDEELSNLKNSALLHDIGKIGVPDQVLLKDGKLTDEEFEWIKKHPRLGATILQQIQPYSAMEPMIPGVCYHHERFDGKGYPDGLKGYKIPKFGRIIAVADAFDAMTSDRPYRKGMPSEKALQILKNGAGTQWDPEYASLFVSYMGDYHQDQLSV